MVGARGFEPPTPCTPCATYELRGLLASAIRIGRERVGTAFHGDPGSVAVPTAEHKSQHPARRDGVQTGLPVSAGVHPSRTCATSSESERPALGCSRPKLPKGACGRKSTAPPPTRLRWLSTAGRVARTPSVGHVGDRPQSRASDYDLLEVNPLSSSGRGLGPRGSNRCPRPGLLKSEIPTGVLNLSVKPTCTSSHLTAETARSITSGGSDFVAPRSPS